MLGKAIEAILNGTPAIAAIVEGRVYPVSALVEGFPSIYYIVKCTPNSSKNGANMDDWEVTFWTMCTTYDECWPLAVEIKTAMEANSRETVEGVTFQQITATILEDDYEFQFDSFGQKIVFKIKTRNLTN